MKKFNHFYGLWFGVYEVVDGIWRIDRQVHIRVLKSIDIGLFHEKRWPISCSGKFIKNQGISGEIGLFWRKFLGQKFIGINQILFEGLQKLLDEGDLQNCLRNVGYPWFKLVKNSGIMKEFGISDSFLWTTYREIWQKLDRQGTIIGLTKSYKPFRGFLRCGRRLQMGRKGSQWIFRNYFLV